MKSFTKAGTLEELRGGGDNVLEVEMVALHHVVTRAGGRSEQKQS